MHQIQTQTEKLDWESRWAPYDEPTYQSVLREICPDDIVLDIGAGDLRLARRMALICQHVYAIERRASLLSGSLARQKQKSNSNLTILMGDARYLEFPLNITTAVLLMRHCAHYQFYADKLRRAGVKRLITNARWKMDVEIIDLQVPSLSFEAAGPGWYTCNCGEVGFKCASVDAITMETLAQTTEVKNCPTCDRIRH